MGDKGNPRPKQVCHKICRTCQRAFETEWPRKMYCSEGCKRSRSGDGICKHCGNNFQIKGNTTGEFCSTQCWYDYQRESSTKDCPICGKTFYKTGGNQVTCSDECGREYKKRSNPRRQRKCEQCGNFIEKNTKAATRFCSRSCSYLWRVKHNDDPGIRPPLPAGSKVKHKAGYVMVKLPDHPGSNSSGFIMEHRLVMEEHLGRHLFPGEKVHHKNGIRDDNRIENLEVWVGKDPPGIRSQDLVEHLVTNLAATKRFSEDDLNLIRAEIKATICSISVRSAEGQSSLESAKSKRRKRRIILRP